MCDCNRKGCGCSAFDPSKPVQMSDGRPARIIATDRNDPCYPIVALVSGGVGLSEGVCSFYANGRGASGSQLVNIPVRKSKFYTVTPVSAIKRSSLEEARRIIYDCSFAVAIVEYVFEDDKLIETKIVE